MRRFTRHNRRQPIAAILSGVLLLLSLTLIGTAAAQVNGPGTAAPQAAAGTSFMYQGQLQQGGTPVNGQCDLAFRLYDDGLAGNVIGNPITTTRSITNGLFSVALDFGATAINGDARWLAIDVRCPAGSGTYTTLNPRQPLMPTPMALALPGLYTRQNVTSPNVIGGYSGNVISPTVVGGTISGGGLLNSENKVWSNYAAIGGGSLNTASGSFATVGGGSRNIAAMIYGAIGGGYSNTVALGADYGTIAGGRENMVAIFEATVGGGRLNAARGGDSTIGGGFANMAGGGTSFIGGGQGNVVTPTAANGVVAGGQSNLVEGESATVGGGAFNKAQGLDATVGGGASNIATSSYAAIGGGSGNQANGLGATIGGGQSNATGLKTYATLGGGTNNIVNGGVATLGGGSSNQANGDWSFVGGGSINVTSGNFSAIGGGSTNYISNDYATIGGGTNNVASGYIATVPGGLSNTAQGSGSFAAGTRAKANHNGTFVWGDSNPFSDVASTAANQFIARASGGVTFFTASDLTTGVTAAPGSGSWSSVSDRNVKANFSTVDARDVLQRLAQIPISTWNYKTQDAAIRHIGPMAQDFAAAFGVGEDDKHISTIDADGVSLAAIQGLYQIAQEKDQQIAQLQTRLDVLEGRGTPIGSAAPDGLIWFVAGAVISLGAFWLGSRRTKGGTL